MNDTFATNSSQENDHLHVKQTWITSNRLSASSSFDSACWDEFPSLSHTDANGDPDEDGTAIYNSIFAAAVSPEPTGFYTGGGNHLAAEVSALRYTFAHFDLT